VSAAISAARAALAASGHDEADAEGQAPSTRRPWRLRRPVRWRPPPLTRPPAGPNGRPRVVRGAARSLLVTPWFAAGTGFVIAVGLWIYSPHTELKFPDSAPLYSLCQSKGCKNDSPGTGGGLPFASAPGEKINGSQARTRGTAKPDVVTHAAVAGLKFKFTILWQQGQRFGAYVTVSGRSVPSSWRLSFAIPGARIDEVSGASWRPAASGDGGTASAPSWQYGGSGAGYGSGNGADGNANDEQSHGDMPVISFSFTGTGSVATPTTCSFDGSACKFR
jgi:hypothetical protein